jgi:hypothetical protein
MLCSQLDSKGGGLLGESPFIKIPIEMVHILSKESDWSPLPLIIVNRALTFVTAVKPKSHLSQQMCFQLAASGPSMQLESLKLGNRDLRMPKVDRKHR